MVDWGYYDKFDALSDKYLPVQGQGDTVATQVVTVVSKLVYRWYNDGDVFDTTRLSSGEDLSSYANWLRTCHPGCAGILDRVFTVWNDGDYEDLLKDLTDLLFDDDLLKAYNKMPATGSIYKCSGPYRFVDDGWDDGWDDDDDDDDDDWD